MFYKLVALHKLGIKIHLHCFEYDRPHAPQLHAYCDTVHYYPRHINKRNLFKKKPYIVISRTSEALVENLLQDDYPILFEGLHSCYYLEDKRLEQRTKLVRTHNIEHLYYLHLAKVENNLFRRYYFYNEAQKLKNFQHKLSRANGIAAISDNDKLYFEKRFSSVATITAFHPNSEVKCQVGMGDFILYHGNLSVGENNEAALFLIQQIFKHITYPCLIAGNNPSKEVKEAIKRYPHIQLISNTTTEEISQLVMEAQINILPTFQATGIKLKLLAALFTGRHCIANTPMVKDTGLESLCHIKNNQKEIIACLHTLMKTPFTENDIEQRMAVLNQGAFSNEDNAQRLWGLIEGLH